MSESMADLALERALAEERQSRIQGDSSSEACIAAPQRDSRAPEQPSALWGIWARVASNLARGLATPSCC